MRVVFLCGDRSRYGLAHLGPILETFQVVGLVTATDERWRTFRRALAGREPAPGGIRGRLAEVRRQVAVARRREPVAAAVARARIPHLRAADVNAPATLEAIASLRPDLLLSAAYPQIFGPAVLALAPAGAINFHPSLLPRCRGAHPHFWAIATGEPEGGVTAHYMTERLDDGPIVAQITFPIQNLYYGEYYARLERTTPELVRCVRHALDTHATPTPQDETRATFFRNDREAHRRIVWSAMPGDVVWNLVRTEAAFAFLGREPVYPWRARLRASNRNLTNGVTVDAGTVVDLTEEAMVVKTLTGCLEIQSVREGRTIVGGARWARRVGLRLGERFG